MEFENITINPDKSADVYCEIGYEYYTFNSYTLHQFPRKILSLKFNN